MPLRNNHYISGYFFTAPYAVHGISMLKLLLRNGLLAPQLTDRAFQRDIHYYRWII